VGFPAGLLKMEDPLLLLRDATINGNATSLEGDDIFIKGIRFPRDTPTAYKEHKGTGQNYRVCYHKQPTLTKSA